MTFLAWRRCELCGHEANEPAVQPSVAKMPDRVDGLGKILEWGPVLDVIRCRDVKGCQQRARELGRDWPFVEGKPWRR